MKIIKKLCIVFALSCIVIVGMFFSVVSGKPTFEDTYQSVIQRKYEHLKGTNEKKIIIVGGSSAGFGIDASYLEEKTGHKVVNMGLYAGFGNLFNTEIIKENINKGDIVILAYEYTLNEDCFESLGDIDAITTGVDNKLEIYKMLPLKTYKIILGNIINYAKKKYTYIPSSSGVYSSQSFDGKGNMIYKREKCVMENYKDNINIYGQVTKDKLKITKDNLNYLKELKKWIERKGASIYFSVPAVLKEAVLPNTSEFNYYKIKIEEAGIDFISDPEEYLFDSQYMYDTIYHCNSKGERKRTELLYKDLKPYLDE